MIRLVCLKASTFVFGPGSPTPVSKTAFGRCRPRLIAIRERYRG